MDVSKSGASRRSRQRLLGLAVAGLVALSACSGVGGSSDEPVTISFWDDNGGPDRTPVYEELIKIFEADNPGITVQYTGLPAAEAAQKYETAVAGNATPDVGIVAGWQLSSLAAQGALMQLDDRVADDDNVNLAEDAITAGINASFDGNLYLLPMSSTPDTLWYRADWFAEAGLEPPTSWSNFLTAAEALNDPANDRYGFVMRGGAGSINQLVSAIFSCSGEPTFFDEDGRTRLNSPASVECAQLFADMYQTVTADADIGYGYQEMVTAFGAGKAATMQHNLGSARNHVDAFGPDVANGVPLPISDITGNRTIVTPMPGGPAIFAGTDHEEAAWKFATFLVSHESNSTWNEAAGQIPTNVDARADAWVTDDAIMSGQIDALADTSTVLVSTPMYLPDWNAILGDMAPEFQKLLLDETTAQDFMDLWADKLNAAEAEYRELFGDD